MMNGTNAGRKNMGGPMSDERITKIKFLLDEFRISEFRCGMNASLANDENRRNEIRTRVAYDYYFELSQNLKRIIHALLDKFYSEGMEGLPYPTNSASPSFETRHVTFKLTEEDKQKISEISDRALKASREDK